MDNNNKNDNAKNQDFNYPNYSKVSNMELGTAAKAKKKSIMDAMKDKVSKLKHKMWEEK